MQSGKSEQTTGTEIGLEDKLICSKVSIDINVNL